MVKCGQANYNWNIHVGNKYKLSCVYGVFVFWRTKLRWASILNSPKFWYYLISQTRSENWPGLTHDAIWGAGKWRKFEAEDINRLQCPCSLKHSYLQWRLLNALPLETVTVEHQVTVSMNEFRCIVSMTRPRD